MFKPGNKKSKVLDITPIWSSSEYTTNLAYYTYSGNGIIGEYSEYNYFSVRGFATLI